MTSLLTEEIALQKMCVYATIGDKGLNLTMRRRCGWTSLRCRPFNDECREWIVAVLVLRGHAC